MTFTCAHANAASAPNVLSRQIVEENIEDKYENNQQAANEK